MTASVPSHMTSTNAAPTKVASTSTGPRDAESSQEFLERTSSEAACCGGESLCSTDQPHVGSANHGGPATEMLAREGCPPPLQWQQVVAAFREQSLPWHTETPAGRIEGRVWGEGPTLVMLNGLGGSSELFALCAYLLKAQCRCVLIDYPANSRVSWRTLCDSISEVIEEFASDEGCYLFGTSIGSAMAMEVALKVGPRVRGLILHAAFAHLPLTIFERLAARLLRWMPGRAQSIPLWSGLQQRSHRLWFPPIDPTRWTFYLQNAGAMPVATLAQRFGMLSGCDLRSQLGPRISFGTSWP